jgi:hypothetical protein
MYRRASSSVISTFGSFNAMHPSKAPITDPFFPEQGVAHLVGCVPLAEFHHERAVEYLASIGVVAGLRDYRDSALFVLDLANLEDGHGY